MLREKGQALKEHLKEHKEAYIAGTVCLAVGVAGGIAINQSGSKVIIKNWRFWSPGDNISQLILPALGDPGNVIKCIETGKIYASQGQYARENNVSATDVCNHLKGRNSNLNGVHLKIVGKAGHPLAE